MENNIEGGKINRILELHSKLLSGKIINKREFADSHNVNERTVQRDIDTIRSYYATEFVQGEEKKVVYDREKKGYTLKACGAKKLTSNEILAMCKILYNSRAFVTDEMKDVISKLVALCDTEKDKERVKKQLRNEAYHYTPLQHGKPLFDIIWSLSNAINEQRRVSIEYTKMDGKVVQRELEPVGILFSEFYFYLMAYIHGENIEKDWETPTIYRIDRIKSLEILKEGFSIVYAERFQEGQYRKNVHYMYGGKLRRIKFEYSGPSIEAIKDRLPTADVKQTSEGKYIVSAEIFEAGIDMWLGSQGDKIKLLNDWRGSDGAREEG